MNPIFTLNDLIFYAYGEGTEEEKKTFFDSLVNDEKWQQRYSDIVAVKEGLDCALIEPPESCINRILDYSRTWRAHKASRGVIS